MGCIGFFLYGPDALMTGAGAIDVGSARTAVLAAGIINGMGSIGSLVQEVIMAKVLADAGTGAAFGILLVCAVGAAGFLSIVLWRNARGLASL
jgi:sugar phosphate permease